MTDNTQELEEILEGVANEYSAGGNYENAKPLMVEEAEQALLDWHNKQVLEIIGEDEIVRLEADHNSSAAKKKSNRNWLRYEHRNKLKEGQSYE